MGSKAQRATDTDVREVQATVLGDGGFTQKKKQQQERIREEENSKQK